MDENARVVAELCASLDGLPLAIELAAAWTRVLSLAAINLRLGQRLDLLTSTAVDRPERHRTLRNAIAWSYGLLSDSEQAIFRRLAVFAGGGTFDVIDDVCRRVSEVADVPDSLEVLRSLVDKGLVQCVDQPNGEPRFIMLETIRLFALDELEQTNELTVTQQRHADYFLRFAEEAAPLLSGHEQGAWFDALEREHDNLRATLQFYLGTGDADALARVAVALYWFWEVRGYLGEGQQWLAAAAEMSTRVRTALRAAVLRAAGHLAFRRGEYELTISLEEQSRVLALADGDEAAAAESLQPMANAALARGQREHATQLFEQSLATFQKHGDRVRLARYAFNLGLAHLVIGDLSRASTALEQAMTESRRTGHVWAVGMCMGVLALVDASRGHWPDAAYNVREALKLMASLGFRWGFAHALAISACVAVRRGQMWRGVRLFGAAESTLEQIGARLWPLMDGLVETHVEIGRARLGADDFTTAWLAGRSFAHEEAIGEALQLTDYESRIDADPDPPAVNGLALTRRELEVARLVADGLTNQKIADVLVVAPGTVAKHVEHILGKTGFTTRVHIATWVAAQPRPTAGLKTLPTRT